MNTLIIKKFQCMIERERRSLIAKASRSGLYEDFGRVEVAKISRIKDEGIMSGTIDLETGGLIMKLLYEFSEWCANFDLQELNNQN